MRVVISQRGQAHSHTSHTPLPENEETSSWRQQQQSLLLLQMMMTKSRREEWRGCTSGGNERNGRERRDVASGGSVASWSSSPCRRMKPP